jgi:O-antigen ligase
LAVFLASLACAFIGLPHWLNGEFSDIRQISIFISHIRFALLIDLSILIGLWILKFNPIQTKSIERWLIGIAIAWMIIFLFILQSLTGIAILLLLLLIGGISFVFKTYSLKRAILFLSIPVLLFTGVFFLISNSWNQYHTPDSKYSKPLALKTKLGNSYSHNFDVIENGHFINSYVCELELRNAWKLRSKLCIDSNDKKGHVTYSTLIRFLNSKGFTKDSEGISSLSDKEIHFIEQGIANVNYTGLWGIRMRLFQLFWELDYNRRGGKTPIGYSVMMKLEFWKTALSIIKQHPILGVGTGDVTDAFKVEYTKLDSWLNEKWRLTSHNYYLYIAVALGIPGLIIFLILISAPFILTVRQSHYFPLTIFFWIAIISMLTEDTLNTQAGASFVAFFYCFFLFSRPIIKSISSSSLSDSSED